MAANTREITQITPVITPVVEIAKPKHVFDPYSEDQINHSIKQSIEDKSLFIGSDYSVITITETICISFKKLAFDAQTIDMSTWEYVFVAEIHDTINHKLDYMIIRGEKALKEVIEKIRNDN